MKNCHGNYSRRRQISGLWLRWRQHGRNDLGFKSATRVRAVAERLVAALPATTQTNHCAPRKIILVSRGIQNFEFALDPQGSIVVDCYLGGHDYSK